MVETKPNVDDSCANYLKALGDPTRLRIVKALRTGPLTVSDLAELLEVELQTVSHHLRILFHAKLLTLQREGKFRYYKLNDCFVKKRQSDYALELGCCTLGLRGD